jgi:hypothetical protein
MGAHAYNLYLKKEATTYVCMFVYNLTRNNDSETNLHDLCFFISTK